MTKCDVCGTERAVTYKRKENFKVCPHCYRLKELSGLEEDTAD